MALSADNPTVVEDAMTLLRREGGRATRSRRVILQALVDAGEEHRTAEQLAEAVHARHPDVHPATVYRALERFEELGIAHHAHLGHGPAQWHLGHSAHPHLTCEGCGKVVEADPATFAGLAERVLLDQGFAVNFRHFAVTGICASCLERASEV